MTQNQPLLATGSLRSRCLEPKEVMTAALPRNPRETCQLEPSPEYPLVLTRTSGILSPCRRRRAWSLTAHCFNAAGKPRFHLSFDPLDKLSRCAGRATHEGRVWIQPGEVVQVADVLPR